MALEAVGEPHRPVRGGRVVRVRWACQLAVEVAPVLPAMSIRSACARTLASSSASWALADWISARAAVVSAASIDHTGIPATSLS